VLVLLVGAQVEDDRKFAAAARAEHVGLEAHAIAHRHVEVFVYVQAVIGLRDVDRKSVV
jgi:hypothetical protein